MARQRATNFEEKRKAILASAAAVFAERGMESASMSQIAQFAKVSKALLYHYYPSKDALIFAIVHNHLVGLEAAVRGAIDPALSAQDRLGAMIWAVLKNYEGSDNAHNVQLNGTMALTDEQRESVKEIERRIVREFAHVLGQINPVLVEADRQLLTPVTMSLFGMLNWVYLWFRNDGAMNRSDYAKLATQLILNGVKSLT